MKKYAADNMLFLREQYPEIYKLISNRTPDQKRFFTETAKNGQANLVFRPDNQPPIYLYSRYDPGQEAARWVESLEADILNACDVLVIGFGLGYHVDALLKAFPDKRFYLYEPELELLLHAIESTDLRPVLDNRQIAAFAVGDDQFVLEELLTGMFKAIRGNFAFTILPFCKRLYPDLKEKIVSRIPKIARGYGTDLNTISHFKTEWIENLIVNMERNLRTPSFYPLKDICRGVPAVIAGSGPSLGMVVDTLRILKNHAFIIAAGTSVQSLLYYGIEPHLIVSMDPGEPNRRAFEHLNIRHIPFLYIPTIKHTAIRDDQSPYLMHAFFDMDVISRYLMDLTSKDAVLASTSSVTGTAIQAAVHLGCSDIIFVGQDFSYPNQQVYASGVSHISEPVLKKRVEKAKLTVANVLGGVNLTTPDLLQLKTDVEAVIQVFSETSFYNASPVGAVIEHTKSIKLEELLRRFSHRTLDEGWFKEQIIKRLKPYPVDRINRIKRRIMKTVEELRVFNEIVQKLYEHLLHYNTKNEKNWFVRFETLWSQVWNHQLYKRIFSFFLAREQILLERYWEEMRIEMDLDLKYQKLLFCIKPLMDELRNLILLMDEHLTVLSKKLSGKGTSQ